MTPEEALRRFKGDLEFMRQVSSHTTDTMRMYEHAITALEAKLNDVTVVHCNITKEALLDMLKPYGNLCVVDTVENIDWGDTVGAHKGRPRGEWIGDTDYDATCKCSSCRMIFDTDKLKMVMVNGKYELPPCCPNCGARLVEKGADNDK